MKKDIFRPIDFWKSAFISMSETSFFELLRSVFGKIKTPFNKQHLLNDLEKFLLREDIQKIIMSYIDEDDAKIIAATALFGEPSQEELANFFSGEYNNGQLSDIIINMEERFILYRFKEEKTGYTDRYGIVRSGLPPGAQRLSRLALNPVLKPVLLPFIEDTSALFPVLKTGKSPKNKSAASAPAQERIVISDLLIAGLLSFALQNDPFFRSDETNNCCVIRRRIIDEGKKIFPGIELEKTINALQMLGLFYAHENLLVPDKKYFEDFGLLSAQERMEYCAAALLIYSELPSHSEILPPLFRARIRETVSFIHSFLESLKDNAKTDNAMYPEKTLKRTAEILRTQTQAGINTKALIEILEKTNLIENASPELKRLGAIAHNKPQNNKKPVIAVDSGFSILVYPEINFSDAISLASFLNIHETGSQLTAPVFRFELDKESAVRAFDNNTSAVEIIDLLNKLSGSKADETLKWNLEDWEKRHKEITLRQGVILSLSEEHRYLIETEPLASLIGETLAEGLYLLREEADSGSAIEDAVSALRCAGVDIIGRRKIEPLKPEKAAVLTQFPKPSAYTPRHFTAEFTADSKSENSSAAVNNGKTTAVIIDKFHSMLEKIALREPEKAELSARIDRRLVLCETQLKDANIRYEKLEARLMDYAGKQNIAKQAISQQSPVEIVWSGSAASGKARNPDGEKIFGFPKALEKEGNEQILVLNKDGDKDFTRIPLAKISLLRRIKKSIFET